MLHLDVPPWPDIPDLPSLADDGGIGAGKAAFSAQGRVWKAKGQPGEYEYVTVKEDTKNKKNKKRQQIADAKERERLGFVPEERGSEDVNMTKDPKNKKNKKRKQTTGDNTERERRSVFAPADREYEDVIAKEDTKNKKNKKRKQMAGDITEPRSVFVPEDQTFEDVTVEDGTKNKKNKKQTQMAGDTTEPRSVFVPEDQNFEDVTVKEGTKNKKSKKRKQMADDTSDSRTTSVPEDRKHEDAAAKGAAKKEKQVASGTTDPRTSFVPEDRGHDHGTVKEDTKTKKNKKQKQIADDKERGFVTEDRNDEDVNPAKNTEQNKKKNQTLMESNIKERGDFGQDDGEDERHDQAKTDMKMNQKKKKKKQKLMANDNRAGSGIGQHAGPVFEEDEGPGQAVKTDMKKKMQKKMASNQQERKDDGLLEEDKSPKQANTGMQLNNKKKNTQSPDGKKGRDAIEQDDGPGIKGDEGHGLAGKTDMKMNDKKKGTTKERKDDGMLKEGEGHGPAVKTDMKMNDKKKGTTKERKDDGMLKEGKGHGQAVKTDMKTNDKKKGATNATRPEGASLKQEGNLLGNRPQAGAAKDETRSETMSAVGQDQRGGALFSPGRTVPTLSASALKAKERLSKLASKMQTKLSGGRFRWLNEQLYTTTGAEAFKMFKADRAAFDEYHKGFSSQVQKWPVNPVDVLITEIKSRPQSVRIADFGCGDAKIARSVRNKVYSFDLVAVNKHVTACNMAKVPLGNAAVDVAVFCLSLMGTDYADFLREAWRVLKSGGELKVAEVVSRIGNVDDFVQAVSDLGFDFVSKDDSNKMFILFDFVKAVDRKPQRVVEHQLKACKYKKR